MPLWTRTKKPNWTPNIPDTNVTSARPGWERREGIHGIAGEILVCIHLLDEDVCNFEYEDGFNIMLEQWDHDGDESFLLLEQCP